MLAALRNLNTTAGLFQEFVQREEGGGGMEDKCVASKYEWGVCIGGAESANYTPTTSV